MDPLIDIIDDKFEDLEDFIAQGLDEDLSTWNDLLIQYMQNGTQADKLCACCVLTSWGQTVGFEQMLEWLTELSSQSQPDAINKNFFRKTHFPYNCVMMAQSIQTARLCLDKTQFRILVLPILKLMLKEFHKLDFGRSLSETLMSYQPLLPDLLSDMVLAVESHIRIDQQDIESFLQTTSLLAPIAMTSDTGVARLATLILDTDPPLRIIREVIHGLGFSGGKQADDLLQSQSLLQKTDCAEELKRARIRSQQKKDETLAK